MTTDNISWVSVSICLIWKIVQNSSLISKDKTTSESSNLVDICMDEITLKHRSPFCRRHFQSHVLTWKLLYFGFSPKFVPIASIKLKAGPDRHCVYQQLSYPPPLDKMLTILADDNFKCISLNEYDRIPIRISLKFVPRSPIDNKPALVQETAWRRTGDKPLPELMLIRFTVAYMRH